jgi:hypothetical protein
LALAKWWVLPLNGFSLSAAEHRLTAVEAYHVTRDTYMCAAITRQHGRSVLGMVSRLPHRTH